MLLGAILPMLGEAAVAAGAPGVATRAVAGAATGAAFSRMSTPTAMVAREASYQMQQEPAPDPQADALLERNDLSAFPNIQRALAEPGGRTMFDKVFHDISLIEPTGPPVDMNAMLSPEPLANDDIELGAPVADDY